MVSEQDGRDGVQDYAHRRNEQGIGQLRVDMVDMIGASGERGYDGGVGDG